MTRALESLAQGWIGYLRDIKLYGCANTKSTDDELVPLSLLVKNKSLKSNTKSLFYAIPPEERHDDRGLGGAPLLGKSAPVCACISTVAGSNRR